MHIQDVNVVRAKALQALLDADFHRLRIVSEVVDLLFDGRIAAMRCVGVLHRRRRTYLLN